ncbi:hypothetical protein C7974DRAFT_108257 [Boeremia exigua]|uniref:uncharacterized protein n=1 Tax=Boeremia exigua TaxID=749465 RepID=UPI001E8D1A33|nr:uncharacterized protein C7974DRAFT_108257 [Boeremia exigua]KAH6642769.1 hypothetical protein C7974DRAFT_108257 [Boeremia exigua]
MARLLDLPPSILNYVFDYVSKKELHALAHTCHSSSKEAIPRLYRNLRFAPTGSASCARKLALLLRTFLERPSLSLHVASIRLSGAQLCWNKCNPWPGEDSRNAKLWGLDACPILTRAQLIFASNMFYQFVDDDMQQSQPQFRGRCADALATLVLTRLTEVRYLELGDGFLRYSLFLPQLLKRTDYLFPKLHGVTLGDKSLITIGVAYMDLNLLRPIFYSSTITKFECSMSQPWRFQWNDSKPPRSNTLTSLTLFRTNISRATLGELLSATPKLKYLHYEHEFVFNAATSTGPSLSPYLGLDELNTALFPVRDTLEECHFILRLGPGSISTTEYPLASVRFPAVQGTLTMLKFMPRLTKVEVPMTMLLGWYPNFAAKLEEVLPHGIVDITLRDDLVRYCPWVAPSNAENKVVRIAEYIQGRAFHATQLESLKVRLTSAKRSLVHSIGALSMSTSGRGSHTGLVRGKKSETYGWRFENTKPAATSPTALCHVTRKDSVFRPMSPLFESCWSETNFF